ncbi:hypothetical protein [Bradyrhizobium paxllaeri]|nr:hypothetical protein [Bradyrhizobium paxllaeri]
MTRQFTNRITLASVLFVGLRAAPLYGLAHIVEHKERKRRHVPA